MTKLELDFSEVTPTPCLASLEMCHHFFKCLDRDSHCSCTFLCRSLFGIKTSHPAFHLWRCSLQFLFFVVIFLLNKIPSCLDFFLSQAVVELQDMSELSLYSAEIYLISVGYHSFILL